MADDDIEKLLAEIDQMNSGSSAQPPARKQSAEVEKKSEVKAPRLKWALICTVGAGAAGFFLGSILFLLPWVNSMSTGLGAALGGFVAGLFSRPPKWIAD